MRALVLWAAPGSPNLGVRALAEGTAALVRRTWPGAEVVTADYGDSPAPVRMGDPRVLAREWVSGRGGLLPWLRGFDVVVDTRSGDSFADIYGLQRLSAMSAVARTVRRAGVPLVLGPQTLGPFRTRRGRLLARWSMAGAALTMARDSRSAAYAAELGRPVGALTTDVVFAMDVPRPGRRRDVVLNVSGLLWRPNPHVDSAAYRATVARLHRGLVAAGREVTLLAHVLDSPSHDNDVPAVREFAAGLSGAQEVVVPRSLEEVRQVLAGAAVVVGSRMHACLNALSVGTPAVPLAYSRKFAPLLGDLGWHHSADLRDDRPEEEVLRLVTGHPLAAEVPALRQRAQVLLGTAETALRAVAVTGAARPRAR